MMGIIEFLVGLWVCYMLGGVVILMTYMMWYALRDVFTGRGL
jgi:hypothetical protein